MRPDEAARLRATRRASSELAAKSSPSACLSRSAWAPSPAPAAGQSKPEPMSVENEKRVSGWLSARRLTMSATAWASALSDFKNLSRAGVAAKRSRASTRVPERLAAGLNRALGPVFDTSLRPVAAPAARVRISSRDTEAIDGSASPRKPKVAIAVKSPSGIFEVAWRSTESLDPLRPCRARRRKRE